MKSKIAKKLLATSVAAAMTLGLVACGGDEVVNPDTTTPDTTTPDTTTPDTTTPDTTTPDTTTPDTTTPVEDEVEEVTVLKDANGNVYDLGGMEIVVGDWWTPEPDPEAEKTAYDEAFDEYIDFVQTTYNFKISKAKTTEWGTAHEDFLNDCTGAVDKNQIYALWFGPSLAGHLANGLLYNLSSLDCLDFSKAKYVSGIHNLISKGGEAYAMSAEAPEPRCAIYVNYDQVEAAGLTVDELYDLQESGQWTWDKFIEICDKITRDTDGDGQDDVYAFTGQASRIYEAAVYSNGGDFVGKDANGKYYFGLEDQVVTDAMNWVLDDLFKYNYPQPADSNWDYFKAVFQEGKVAFAIDQAYMSEGEYGTSNCPFEYGFLCFPKGPAASDYTNCYEDNAYVIPAYYGADKAWKLAFAYDLMTEPVPGFEDYEGWRVRFEKSGFGEEESGKAIDLTLARLTQNGKGTYHNLVAGIQIGEQLLYSVGPNNWAEKVAECKDLWIAKIDEANQ